MQRSNRLTVLILSTLFAVMLAAPAFAGGPLIIFDPVTRTPYAYPVGPVPVYTDLGNNGNLTNAQSNLHTATGFAEWTGVASSYFSAAIAGNFSAVGLPDITGANAGLVVGADNGGGIHVMYDNDGTITANFFGAPPGVLGIASPDFALIGQPVLTESWAMLNGTAADLGDVGGISFSGVFTHEFGHSINLAHTQTNGAVGFFGDPDVPGGCPPAGYSGGLTFNGFETMYPFLDPSPGSVGIQQATVNVLDDIASISNVYPTGGWPNNTGTITGRVFLPDGVTEVTGVNVIARNLADPFVGATSALSGDYTQGDLGPDGLFTLTGLTPGAQYVLYIDQIVAGGFSTTPVPVNPEEYWNSSESADENIDAPCDVTAIAAVAGVPSTNDIIINGDPNSLPLGDDDYVEVALPFTFSFCGNDYNSVFVGSNGFVTFGAGDTDFSPSIADLLGNEARIAPFWTDLSPNQGGSISAQPNGPNFEITYSNVTQFNAGNSNNCVLTLKPDGTYDMAYSQVDATGGLTGRTPGGGVGDPGETDLTAAAQPIGTGVSTVYEFFQAADNDLENQFLAWDTCEEDQGGGAIPIVLGDDAFKEITLPFTFTFCETPYNSVFVGSNGYLTFGAGDTDFSQSVGDLLANEPRIAGLWTDLSPNQAGSVTWEDIGGAVEITFTGVTEFLAGNSNNFQYTLRSDNTYSVEYGQVDATTALCGRSEGGGATNPGPTDLSAAVQPIGAGQSTVYENFIGNQDVANSLQDWDPCTFVHAIISVDPASLSETLCVDQTSTQTLTIANTGDGTLDFALVDVELANKPSMGTNKADQGTPYGLLLPRTYPVVARRDLLDRADKISMESDIEKGISPANPMKGAASRVPLPHIFAMTLLTENFDGGFPAGWSAIDNEGNGVVWSVPQAFEANYTGGTGDAAGASSDGNGAAAFDTELRTPVINGFGPNAVLSYTANYQNFAFLDFLDVDISTDGGANWTTVLSWNEDHGGFFGTPGEQVVLALDPFIGAATEFVLRWHYYDPNAGNDWDWYAMIDDVMVVSDDASSPCPWLSIVPDNGSVAPGGSTDLTVNFDATGLAGGTYNCEFRINSNASNAPQVIVPVELTVIEDSLPPHVVLNDKATLWPPNHKYSTVSVADMVNSVVDNCDGPIDESQVRIDFVTSDEADNANGTGDGNTTNDIVIAGDCASVDLRAERSGNGNGRVYQVHLTVTDSYGNTQTAVYEACVPLGLDGKAAIAGAAVETVQGNCQGGNYAIADPEAPVRQAGATDELALGNHPNPFNPVTTLSFTLQRESYTSLRIFNGAGRLVRSLVSANLAAGEHSYVWNGRDDQGTAVPSGIYMYKFVSGSIAKTGKMVMLK